MKEHEAHHPGPTSLSFDSGLNRASSGQEERANVLQGLSHYD